VADAKSAKRNAERWALNTKAKEKAQTQTSSVPTVTVYDEARGKLVRQEARQPKRDGLEWLRNKDHISHEEYQAGLWYAERYRWAHMEDSVPIASALGAEMGTGFGGFAPEDMETAHRIMQARRDFIAIENRIGWDTDMELALLFVCVHGLRFAEASLNYGESAMTIGEFKKTLGHIAQVRKCRA
jgi:hypothetical protein